MKESPIHYAIIGKCAASYQWHYYTPCCGAKNVKRLSTIRKETTCKNCKKSADFK